MSIFVCLCDELEAKKQMYFFMDFGGDKSTIGLDLLIHLIALHIEAADLQTPFDHSSVFWHPVVTKSIFFDWTLQNLPDDFRSLHPVPFFEPAYGTFTFYEALVLLISVGFELLPLPSTNGH